MSIHNLNDSVSFKPTPAALEKMNRGLPAKAWYRLDMYGRLNMPLWELMCSLGPHVFNGQEPLIVDNQVEL